MIRNTQEQTLFMDFSSMYPGNDHPSDIDMAYVCRDNTLIIGEIKNERGFFTDGQRHLIEKFLNSHKGDAVGLFITHDKYVQRGDTEVDVSNCYVKEIYIKAEGKWRFPKRPVKVKEVIKYYKER